MKYYYLFEYIYMVYQLSDIRTDVKKCIKLEPMFTINSFDETNLSSCYA